MSLPRSKGKWWPSGEDVDVDALVDPDKLVCRAVPGITRQGKGQWFKTEIIPALKRRKRDHLVIDPHDEHTQQGVPRRNHTLGACTHRVEAPHFARWVRENEARFRTRGHLSLAVVPVGATPKARAEEIAQVLAWVKARGEMDLILEEMTSWAGHAGELLTEVATGWLKLGVRPWFVAQGFRFFPIEMRSQVVEVFAFHHVDDSDIRTLSRLCGEQFAGQVLALQPLQFVARNRYELDPALARRFGVESALPKQKKR